MKIYVVTQGEYSDYHIITATTDKSIAEAVAKKFEHDYYRKPDIEVYENAEVYLKPCWSVWFDACGAVTEIDACRSSYQYEDVGKVCRYDFGQTRVCVSADDETAAIKIAAEMRAKFLAQKAGL